MTLIVAVMTPVQVILVSDRRFSGSGKPDEDERNKVAVFMCNNGRAAIAFTGMAAFAKFKTTEMLLDAFSRAAAPDHLFLPTIGRVAGVLTEEVKKLKIPADKKHLTVIVAGYEYRLPEGAKTVLFKITNSGEHKSALDTFSIQRRRDTREDIGVFGVFSFGRTEGVLRQDGAFSPLPKSTSACRSSPTICSALCRFFITNPFRPCGRQDSLTSPGSDFGEGVTMVRDATMSQST